MEKEQFNKILANLKKIGLLVDVVNSNGPNTMVTPKGYEEWEVLNIFVSHNGANVIDTKEKKSTQDKMDSAIKTMTKVGAGISQMMQAMGGIAGEPPKMDMKRKPTMQNNKPKKKWRRYR